MASFTVDYAPLANSELASAGIVLIPIVVLFALLFMTRVIVAAVVGLAAVLIVSTQLYHVPAAQALLAAVNGALFGAWPVCLIILAGAWRPAGPRTRAIAAMAPAQRAVPPASPRRSHLPVRHVRGDGPLRGGQVHHRLAGPRQAHPRAAARVVLLQLY